MDEKTIDKHSVNCYFCSELVDERECMPADEFNGDDGGSICPSCLEDERHDQYAQSIVVGEDHPNNP